MKLGTASDLEVITTIMQQKGCQTNLTELGFLYG